ncbi:MAG TPA: oligosaccharide flippase family protein [Bryobacteraceae bacterium]|nr:oligosaccharide flippase family protein [Bryobacteraceae bacterium]
MSIRSNFAWTLGGYAVYAACQWGMLVVLAKLGTAEMVGQFALGLAITAPLLMFTNLQLRSVLATDARGEYGFPDYLGLRLCSTLLALAALPAILAIGGLEARTYPVVLLVGVAKAVESVSDVHYGLLQHHERMRPIAGSLMIKGILSIAAFAIAVYFTHSLVWAVAGLIAAWALVLVIYDRRQTARYGLVRPGFRFGALKELAWRSLPLGIMSMLVSLNANIPRYFVESRLGPAALGIFAALLYPLTAGTFVVTALGQAALPVMARHFAAGRRIAGAFNHLLLRVSGTGFLLGVAGVALSVVAGRRLLTLFYRPEYGRHASVLCWLAVAAAMNYVASFLNAGVTATRHFRVLIAPYVVQTVLAGGLSSILVSAGGLMGAAWASCGISAAGCAIPLLILAWVNKRAEAGAN